MRKLNGEINGGGDGQAAQHDHETPPRPRPCASDLGSLPQALHQLTLQDRWVIWKYDLKGGKWTKPPNQAKNPKRNASNNDPQTWSSYAIALKATRTGEFTQHGGLGYNLLGSNIAAFDLDNCRDKNTGEIDPWALDLVQRANSYAEVTPSGGGIRIIGLTSETSSKTQKQFGINDARSGAKCEIYRKCERYITITGLKIDAAPDQLVNIDALIDDVASQLDKGRTASARKVAPINFAGELPSVDIDALPVRADVRDLIVCGKEIDDNFASRSEAVWFVLCSLARAKVAHDEMLSIILNRDNRISDHIFDQDKPRRYAERQVKRAIAKAAEEVKGDAGINSPENIQAYLDDVKRSLGLGDNAFDDAAAARPNGPAAVSGDGAGGGGGDGAGGGDGTAADDGQKQPREEPKPNDEPKPDSRDQEQPRKEPAGDILLCRSAPFDNAKQFILRDFTYQSDGSSGQTLLHHQGIFYRWKTTHYEEIENEELEARIWRFLADATCYNRKGKVVAFNPDKSNVSNMRSALAAHSQLYGKIIFPYWDGPSPVPATEILSCANGLLHLPTRKLLPHTPLLRNTYALDYAFEPTIAEPALWLKFLAQLWPDDAASIETLQEIFGLMLTGDTSFQKLFLVIGPRRGGKGTIARVLRALLGGEVNVPGPSLASLCSDFGLQNLIGKPLAIISDSRISGRADVQVIVERLLSISGEDTLDVPRKFLPDWTGQLPTRFIICTNILPKFSDASSAIMSRFIILQTTQSFFGKEDLGLTGKLLKELPGILNWSLDGLARLRERGYFKEPDSANATHSAFENLSNPIGAFIDECCDVEVGASVAADTLFNRWMNWNKRQGNEHTTNNARFGADLHAAMQRMNAELKRTRSGGRCGRFYVYEGIKLKKLEDDDSGCAPPASPVEPADYEPFEPGRLRTLRRLTT